ncbi:pyrimidine-nucleoside phosphorylase [Desulfotomaculum nigrificans CO-1-SRB]|uniref:Pyrimidine-nucleoside phosphorylase n=1 Tax=Desulfotomaculum nigrificans (strain DSM 14880 / VKM B-2319 / CO-1-SRB) TaxID=868595 RepID=F6B9L2_DESCC|nr:pyrimidine-nucleoside phosphorylase [Desulfotomaculum nigrificans]AEF94908.1 pyrimidine-nucleoside phosphorylase [Desulfotomaculum nigrificans CO-1-SRB]
MRMVDLIHKKREGGSLTRAEIEYIIQGYTRGEIPDYQMSAFAMTVFFKGMNKQEIADFTNAIVHSGETIDLSPIKGIKVDKHSTGGVGDKVSLIIIPLVAAVGVPVAKMSGRGLGHTGGTIDKLESIEGFRTELSREEFIHNVNTYKMAIAGQSANLTPADKKLYALRDVTDTVDSIPLIASSVMSKKIASGADCIVLDVKVGSGAFMKSLAQAKELAQTMVEIGKSLNRKTIAVITDMSQPLGYEIGNANEVKEAITVLQGKGPEDLTVVALTIASYMTILGEVYKDFDQAYRELERVIKSGQAFAKLKELVQIQGGNPEVIDHPDKLPQAKNHIEVKAWQSGYVESINAEAIGITAMLLGAGRKKKGDLIDHSAGITILKKIGDEVKAGEPICILHTNMEECGEAEQMIKNAFSFSKVKPPQIKYVYEVI